VVDVVVVVTVVEVVVVVGTVVVVVAPVRFATSVPGRLVAPGPGRSAEKSTSPFPVAAMQNTEASVADAGVPTVIGPVAGLPFSVIVRHVGCPKQPGVPGVPPWPGQILPSGALFDAAPVVSGERSTLMGPTCVPS